MCQEADFALSADRSPRRDEPALQGPVAHTWAWGCPWVPPAAGPPAALLPRHWFLTASASVTRPDNPHGTWERARPGRRSDAGGQAGRARREPERRGVEVS